MALAAIPADHTDAHLVNAWGLVASPTSPWWTSNNESDTSTLYDANGTLFPPPPNGPLVVTVSQWYLLSHM